MALRVKKLEKLLRATFQEQGEKIVPPSSQKLWAELQQRPEFAKLQGIEEKLAAIQKKQTIENKGYAIFWRKYRYLTGLIAACFVFVVFFAKFVPVSGYIEDIIDRFLPFGRGAKPQMEISIQSAEDTESVPLPEGETEAKMRLKNFPLSSNNEEASLPPSSANALLEQTPESEFKAASEREEEELQQDSFAADANMAAESERSESQELLFDEETSFELALEEMKHLAPEGIWRIKYIPGEFEFKEGIIIKTESLLLSVQQEYKDPEGRTFSLVQQFLQDDKTPGRIITTADSLDQPIQVGPYNGYLRRDQPGVHTLTWLQEKSIVTLSGELKEEQLYKILASMEDCPFENER